MRLLGPVATYDGDVLSPLTGRSATLVALLVAAQRSWLDWDVLAEEAWTDGVPTRGTVHTAISRCRAALPPALAARLESGQLGYRLILGDGESDLDDFVALVKRIDAAKAHDPADVVLAQAEQALELWTGRACANVLDSQRVSALATSLDRMRWDVTDSGASAALSVGLGARWCERLELVLAAESLRQSSAILLAECESSAGNQAAAMRTLSRLRRGLHEVGLVASPDLVDAEYRILVDEPVRELHPHTQQSFALPSLSAAQEHLRKHRFRPALLEAERVISQQTRLSLDGVAEAWLVVALASDALIRPVAFRHALTQAVQAAILADASLTLRRALALSARATAPGEPNQGIVDTLQTASLIGEDQAWADGAVAVNVACGASATSDHSALELAARVVRSAKKYSSPALSEFAAECWLRLTEGLPEVDEQRTMADWWVRTAAPDTTAFSVALSHRALRALRAGDSQAYEVDISTIEDFAATHGVAEDQAIAMQMRAALLLAQGERAAASTMIDGAADLVLDHPVHQEVAAIQRWWLHLDEHPDRYLADLRAVAELGRSPAYAAILAYTLLRCDDPDGAQVALDSMFVDGRFVVAGDSSYPTAVAGMSEVAVWLGSLDHVDEFVDRLTPYSGQILVAPGHAFVLGAADRFLGQLAMATGRSGEGTEALTRAHAIERRLGFRQPLAATRAVARSLGVSLVP
jgi:hypothetical protein